MVFKKRDNDFEKYMTLAIKMGQKALEKGEVPIGAVFVVNGKVIAAEHNRKELDQDPTAHAEMLVIRKAAEKLGSWRLNQGKLFVTAEPCLMCMGAIIQARIPFLVFGVNEWQFGGVESTINIKKHPMLPKDMEIYGGIMDEKCRDLLQEFFEKQRKKGNN